MAKKKASHKKTKVLAQVKRWSRAEQLAFFGMLLAYLKTIGVLKLGRKYTTKGGKTTSRKKGKPPKGKVPPQLRPYLFKKGHRPVKKKGKKKR